MAWTERYVRADSAGGGDGTTTATSGANAAFTLAEAITNSTSNTGIRYNVMAVGGTFANTTTNRTFNGIATTTAPNWWRGCNTAAGDLDADFVTAKPIISFTTGQMTVSGAHQIFSNLDIQGATTTANGLCVNSSAGIPCVWDRCRFTNTAANSASRAYTANGACIFTRCYFSATSTASAVIVCAAEIELDGCVITGGGVGISHTSSAGVFKSCAFRAIGSHGYELAASTSRLMIHEGNTFRSCGGDGIRFTLLPSIGLIANCLFASGSAWAINNASGANTNLIKRLGNDFWSNSSGTETGFGDSPSLSELSESSDPNTSATNLSLVSTASAKAGGQPGLFENESYTSYLDVGAVQRQEPTGGGGPIIGSPIVQGLGRVA